MFNQQHAQFALLRILAVLMLLFTSLGPYGASTSEARTLSSDGSSSPTPIPGCKRIVPFDPNNFSNPTQIDNKWLPLIPGTQMTLEGRADRGGGLLPHKVVFTVTDLTKVINGVRTLVIWDRDFNDDHLEEAELALFAQDDAGNVWNLGEYPELYHPNGQFRGAPDTWFAGLRGAEGGIHMLARPQLGTPRYLQGSVPKIEFLDCAKVFLMHQRTCVPFDCYGNVLVTDEVSPLDPAGGHQRKYHVPGVGIVQVGAVGDPEGETLVLTNLVHLSPEALAEAREEALKLDTHGYQTRPILYGQTPPAEPLPPAGGLDFEAGNENQNSGQVHTLYLPVILK